MNPERLWRNYVETARFSSVTRILLRVAAVYKILAKNVGQMSTD